MSNHIDFYPFPTGIADEMREEATCPMWRGMLLSVRRSYQQPERPFALAVLEVGDHSRRAKRDDRAAAGLGKPLIRYIPDNSTGRGVA